MDATSVTLDEVFAAARMRAASLVPETSGYLALAVADASARLPFMVEDPMVSLSTEGTIQVRRGTKVVEPADSALAMRDMLGRLLSLSIGSAPALAGAAKPRNADGVEVFIHELESALVPVNRAAARRALARLARETVRAREAGRLRRKRVVPSRKSEPERGAAAEPAPQLHKPAVEKSELPSARRSEPYRELVAKPVAIESVPAVALTTRMNEPLAASEPKAQEAQLAVEVSQAEFDPIEVDLEGIVATPHEPPALLTGDAATMLDTEFAERVLALEPLEHSDLGVAAKSDVEDLVSRFLVSEGAGGTASSPRGIRALAGIDLSPAPPPASQPLASEPFVLVVKRVPAVAAVESLVATAQHHWEPRSAEDASETPPATLSGPTMDALEREFLAGEAAVDEVALESTEETMPVRRGVRWPMVAAIILGFVIAAGLGHYVPALLAGNELVLGN